MDPKSTQGIVEQVRLELSKRFLLQIEYKYRDLLEAESTLSRGAGRLTQEEFFQVFDRCKLPVQVADEKALKAFFKIHSRSMYDTINFAKLFEVYQLTDRLLTLQGVL